MTYDFHLENSSLQKHEVFNFNDIVSNYSKVLNAISSATDFPKVDAF